MTNKEINEAILLELGWVRLYDRKQAADGSMVEIVAWADPEGRFASVPDFCHDMNATHDAEMKLISGRVLFGPEFAEYLHDICRKADIWPLHASALQRSEAIVRTVGRWRDEE